MDPSTTLSYAKLMKPVLGFLHPSHVLGTTDKEESRKDLLYEGARLRKRERGAWTSAPPFGLEKGGADVQAPRSRFRRRAPSYKRSLRDSSLSVVPNTCDG